MSDQAPLVKTIQENVPGQSTAGTDDAWVIGEAEFDGEVTAVSYTAEAAVTGHASNNRTLKLVNKGASGSGTTVMASVTTDASNSLTAGDEKALTLSAVEGATEFVAGDILEWQSDANASGVADPGGLVQVSLSRS